MPQRVQQPATRVPRQPLSSEHDGPPGMPHAPPLPRRRTPEAIAHLVTTPQFRHTLDVLTQALNSGQLHPSHFGVPAEVGGRALMVPKGAGADEAGGWMWNPSALLQEPSAPCSPV